ncbi:MAG: hypothetical protein U0X91_02795 [Spirosomataceae bacterium]
MKKHYHREEEIEQTLQSLEGIRRAEPNPYFYTRLQARMEQKFVKKTGWQWRPAYMYAALGLVLLLNVVTVYTLTRTPAEHTSAADSFANEYGLNSVSSLDTN